ncbi:MAG: hypothetical protein QGI21_05635 [Candidatus Poseidoniaceae archaeon]|nr:hypothetical protein [Candidatus Poseidoniaceae archaeon]
MDRQNSGLFNLAEIVVLTIVILATLSIGYDPNMAPEEELQLSEIDGTLSLVTRSSMDSLGLEDFRTGAIATVDLESYPVISGNCTQFCESTPSGIQITGNVNVTKLRPLESDATFRIEGKLNVTHLWEYSSDSMIVREWLVIDWDLAEFSSQWDVYIHHNPPKWVPSDRYHSSFISSEQGKISRAGPAIFVEELFDDILNVRGCLPNTANCDGVNREEMNLTSKYVKPSEPVEIQGPNIWHQVNANSSVNHNVSNIGELRNMFNLESANTSIDTWCISELDVIDAANSWNVLGNTGTTIAPMNIWLQSIGIQGGSFTATDGVWSEADYGDENACGSFVNSEGVLVLGISKM